MPSVVDYAKAFAGARWFDVQPRAAFCPQIPASVLLHAGPPLRGAAPAPMRNAAIQAIVFEGLAADARGADELLARGALQLHSAQDHGIATPLAQVVSASMPLVAVAQQGEVGYAPLVEGAPPALRFGSSDPQCGLRLRALGDWAASSLVPVIRRQPLVVAELIQAGIAAQEECHARTAAANEALIARLPGLDTAAGTSLRGNPGFVLPILMAAAVAALKVARSTISAFGGNGIEYGLRQRAASTWRRCPAEPPRGPRLAGAEALHALGAIGDSAVVDCCGLGGQALAAAPGLVAEWAAVLPADAPLRRDALLDPNTGIVDPARVVRTASAPLVNLAVLDRAGQAGLIGRGYYCPPLNLFSEDSL